MSNLEKVTAAVQAIPYLYQPIFGYQILGAKPIRNCEDRLADVKKIYDLLSAELGRPLRVLDLGCAQGFFSLNAAKWGGGSDRFRLRQSKHRFVPPSCQR